jgi:hypothetical protein
MGKSDDVRASASATGRRVDVSEWERSEWKLCSDWALDTRPRGG